MTKEMTTIGVLERYSDFSDEKLISERIDQSGTQKFESEILQTNGGKFITNLCQSGIIVIIHNLISKHCVLHYVF